MAEHGRNCSSLEQLSRKIGRFVSARYQKAWYWFVANKYSRIASSFTKRRGKIRAGYFVIYESVFPAALLLEKMIKDSAFRPSIVVIPDKIRGEINERRALSHTLEYMKSRYGGRCEITSSFDEKRNRYIDVVNQFDIICSANPYREMTDYRYTVEYACRRGVLSFFVGYGYVISKWGLKHILNAPSCNLCWRLYLETFITANDAGMHMGNMARNVKVLGYCKMDRLRDVAVKARKRKCIIIAPHHTIDMPDLPLSNFLAYSDFFLELPGHYPEMDFVFRPHPLLRVALEKEDVWGKAKTNAYFEKMSSYPNVIYQNGGDYFDVFVNSDGIIHDCGSFAAEYLFTGHPACYLLKDESVPDRYCNALMKECLKVHYRAFGESDIMDFINNVIVKCNDSLAEARSSFVESQLKINYPHSADAILNDIKQGLGIPVQ